MCNPQPLQSSWSAANHTTVSILFLIMMVMMMVKMVLLATTQRMIAMVMMVMTAMLVMMVAMAHTAEPAYDADCNDYCGVCSDSCQSIWLDSWRSLCNIVDRLEAPTPSPPQAKLLS